MKNLIKIGLLCFVFVGIFFAFTALTRGPEGTNGTYTLSYDVNAWTLRQKWMNLGSINDSTVVRAPNSYFRKIAPLSEILGGYAQKNGTASQYIKGDGTFATFPSITAQVQSDWNAVSGLGVILNKPTIPTNTNQLTNGSGFISSYTETDPVWVTASANYRTKTQNDALYYGIGNSSNFISRTWISAGTGVTYDNTTGIISNSAADPGRIINNATIGLSKAGLNTSYPNVPVGYMVMCPSIILGGAIYVKATENGTTDVWQTVSAPPTL